MLAILTVWTLFTLTFFLMRSVPGDPLTKTKEIPEETRKNLEARYGLDKPLIDQYFIQLNHVFIKGDLGTSFRTIGREVNEIIREQFPVSASVGLFAIAFGVPLGLILGTLAALKRNSWMDRLVSLYCVTGIALPSFLIAYLIQYFIAVYPLVNLGVDPNFWFRPAGWGEKRDLVLPGLTLSFGIVATISRMMRAQMVEIGFSEYIKTAKAKGMSVLRMILFHQFRNAILPIVSILGPLFVGVLGGSLLVESIFGLPGLGRAYLSSIQNSDYNVIMGLTIFFGTFLILVTFVTDIVYGLVDPRIRLS
jgi:oligopeptide transport system permease protein